MLTIEAPEPFVPAEVDLRDFPWMGFEVRRFLTSPVVDLESAEAFRTNVISWAVSWHELPAASLPADDATLARLLGFGRDVKGWRKVRAAGGLRGWVLCSDGRLYHPVVAEKARESWAVKLAKGRRRGGDRGRQQRRRGATEWDSDDQHTGYDECHAPVTRDAIKTGIMTRRGTGIRPDRDPDTSSASPPSPGPHRDPGLASRTRPDHRPEITPGYRPGPGPASGHGPDGERDQDHGDDGAAAATQARTSGSAPDSPATTIGTPARPGLPAMGASEGNPLSERARGVDDRSVRHAIDNRDIPLLVKAYLATDVPKHERDWLRDTNGMQLGAVAAILAWSLARGDPIRLPSGFRRARKAWEALPLEDRKAQAADVLARYGSAQHHTTGRDQ